MSAGEIDFTAACPACGQDCRWTGFTASQPLAGGMGDILTSLVKVACDCEDVQDAEPVEVAA